MNLIFANNLKKELYFLRNGLLRSEIKDNMVNLSNQLNDLNEIVCALDDYQKIMFIYVLSLDTHFFFDCKK